MCPRRADEPKTNVIAPVTRINTATKRRTAVCRRVAPTPATNNTRRPNCRSLRISLCLLRLGVPAEKLEVASTCVFASIYTPLPYIAVHIIEPPGIRHETADLDMEVAHSAVVRALAELDHFNTIYIEIALRPCATGVFPLNLGRKVEFEPDPLA